MTSPSPDVRVLEIREHASRIAELCDDLTGTAPPPQLSRQPSSASRGVSAAGWAATVGATATGVGGRCS